MFEPFRLPAGAAERPFPEPLGLEPLAPTAPAPAPASAPLSFIPSITAASMSSSFG